jgi:hypothetical protein
MNALEVLSFKREAEDKQVLSRSNEQVSCVND